MGHFRDTLMAVCSTPSSPLGPGVPGMVPLLKFRLTGIGGNGLEKRVANWDPWLLALQLHRHLEWTIAPKTEPTTWGHAEWRLAGCPRATHSW